MPCSKCNTDFTLITWKLKCVECELMFCSKCLVKCQRTFFCENCSILNERPPDRDSLMGLKSKEIQAYLNKRNISTHGYLEKAEIVDLFFKKSIPSPKKKQPDVSSLFGGNSVPNLFTQTDEHLSNVASNLEENVNNFINFAEATYSNLKPPNISERFNVRNLFNTDDNDTNTTANSSYNTTGSRRRSENDISAASSNSQSTATNVNAPKESSENKPKLIKLSDLKSVEDIENLSSKQLKQILALNRVTYRGALEKNELFEKVVNLWIESHVNGEKDDQSQNDELNSCKICMDAPLECVILECGHLATCIECGKQLAECPICRQFVTRVVRVFKA